MRKRKQNRKLGLKRDQRDALLRSLSEALFMKEKIQTTHTHAKAVSQFAEKLITKGKKKNFTTEKNLSKLFSRKLVKKILDEIAPRYNGRPGGYTRIIRLAPRKNDGAKISIIELVK